MGLYLTPENINLCWRQGCINIIGLPGCRCQCAVEVQRSFIRLLEYSVLPAWETSHGKVTLQTGTKMGECDKTRCFTLFTL